MVGKGVDCLCEKWPLSGDIGRLRSKHLIDAESNVFNGAIGVLHAVREARLELRGLALSPLIDASSGLVGRQGTRRPDGAEDFFHCRLRSYLWFPFCLLHGGPSLLHFRNR